MNDKNDTKSKAAHIVAMDKNTKGRDFVIGNVHGSLSALQEVLSNLNENDRLFIVGDLIDRGEDSAGVINLIQNDPRIKVIRGNHEEMFLGAIRAIEKIQNNNAVPGDYNECRSILENQDYRVTL